MGKRKKLQELTIKSNFMFGAAMLLHTDNCAGVIERATGIPVDRVEVSREKSMIYHPGYKGVRLDVYAKDEHNTHYDVEMQVLPRPELGKRARYYHSQMDMELLQSGEDYTGLPGVFVIFICDFDPFGYEKYRYTFENQCLEQPEISLDDGAVTIFLSTCGRNRAEVPESLVKFLDFVRADLKESEGDFQDEFIVRLQRTVTEIKESREMEGRFMLWEELVRDERAEAKAEGKAEGRAESVLEILSDLGSVPEEIRDKITSETDLEILKKYLKLAVKAETIEQFCEEISQCKLEKSF